MINRYSDGSSFEYIPRQETDIHPTYTLVHAGYLSPTPTEPQIVISLKSLELLYSLFRAAPAFSIQHFTQVVSDIHKMVYQPYLRTQISLAFDIFYQIFFHLDKLVKQGQVGPNYHLKNSCPACHCKVEDEPECPIQLIVTADGNTSLSRLHHNFATDARVFPSDYFIPREQVNNFADTRKHSQRVHSVICATCEMDGPESLFISDSCLAWKNAWPMPLKSKSGAMQLMDETGLFSVICRYGIVQFLIDMVQSGELAKYPIAATDQLIWTFGHNILLQYWLHIFSYPFQVFHW
ncbi:uncharacterized protein EI90DRAFT_2936850 [Cantharellus anzutake]|uniref:uncharacterized protein n=1 Tax=Cantharellus anzutake TaxID=1750568 RepID=UPI00190512BB|nr:uncharacterized protein EI90DRAFT_2936850 [Cantharellus anzutake]KAF8322793.1 hypothetical protein EI90DRAFT_2936850 [Cantharellus anzutake]